MSEVVQLPTRGRPSEWSVFDRWCRVAGVRRRHIAMQSKEPPARRTTIGRRDSVEAAALESAEVGAEAFIASPAVRTLIAGGVAGVVSRTAVAPLERVKILLQVQGLSAQGQTPHHTSLARSLRELWRTEGMLGLYKGNTVNCVRVFPSSAIQFGAYADLKTRLFGERGARGELLPQERLVAGGLAGAIAQLLTYPLDMVRARISTDMAGRYHNGIVAAIVTVARDEGPAALFRGLLPSLIGIVPYVGIDFAVYDTLRPHMPRNERGEPTVVGKLCAGGFAGACGQTVAYPLDTVRRVLQVQDVKVKHSGVRYGGMLEALVGIGRRDGIVRGLYAGLTVNIVKVIPSVAISFVCFEAVKGALDGASASHAQGAG